MSMISVPKSDLEMIFNLLGEKLMNTTGSSELNKSGKPKKQNSNKGKPTCHGDFVKMICEKFKDEVAAFKTENPDQKGAHLVFAGNYKKEHTEEFAAFEAKWKEEHPKDAVSETTSVVDDAEVASDASGSEKKKRAPMSDEKKAKMKAGREAAAARKLAEKAGLSPDAALAPDAVVPAPVAAAAPVAKKPVKAAKKAITTPVVAPIQSSVAPELFPFSFNGETYLRFGSKLPNGEILYTSGHLWTSKKGAKGDHYGELQDDNTIDMEASEPSV